MTTVSATFTVAAVLCVALAGEVRADEPLVLGGLGDSITAGFNAANFGDNRQYSWSTGSADLVNSFRERLASYTNRPVVTDNEAIVGSRAWDLDRQITRLLPHAPDYVTVTIGANDICLWSDDYDDDLALFEIDVRKAVARIVEERPEATVMLAPIPDMYRMYEIGRSVNGCQLKWDLFNICRPLLASGRNHQDRMDFVERWRRANGALASVASEFPDNVVHDPTVGDTSFQLEHISTKDCFHPSVAGQALLADVAWQLFLNH